MFLEQGAGNLFRFGHTLDGIEQRYRAHIKSFCGRLPFAFVPALEDRPDLPRVADNDGVASLTQRRHSLREQDLRRFVDDDPVEQRVLGQVIADRKAGGCDHRVGAQEDVRLSVEPLIGVQTAQPFALETVPEGGVQSLAGTATVLRTHLDEAVAGRARLRLLDAAAQFAFAGLIESELKRRLDIRVLQVDALQRSVGEVAAHPLDEASRTVPRPRRAAGEGKQVSDGLGAAPHDGQMRNIRERAATFLHFLFEEEAFTLGRGQTCPDLRDVARVLPQGDEPPLLGPQRGFVSTGGYTRRGGGRLLGPGLAPLLENPLTLVEFLDALSFSEAGHQESVAFLCQLVDDVIHRGVGTRDDADGLALGDEGGDQVEDRLRFSRAGRAVDDRDLVGKRGANRVALIDVGVEGHDEMVARPRRRGRRAREERFEDGASRRLRKPLPDVRENGRRCRCALAHPPGIALARVQCRPGPSSLRADFLAYVVKDGGVLALFRRRE